MIRKMYRHGDLLIVSVESAPDQTTPRPSGIVAEGEVTGHAHVLTGGVVLEAKDGEVYLRITEDGAVMTHEEHGPLTLEPGDYQVVHQVEWRPYDAAVARVTD